MMQDIHRSGEYCIDMPNEFPELELAAYMAFARSVLLSNDHMEAWREFAGASNLLAWRYRACWEDWRFYKAALHECRNARTHEEKYQRERALFGMFTAGVSCIETAVYSLAALASHPSLLGIPFGSSQQRSCSPKNFLAWIGPFEQAASLKTTLRELVDAPEWETWLKLRHRMTHRSNLPEIIKAWIGPEPDDIKPISFAATSSTPAIDGSIDDFEYLHHWLTRRLASLLTAGITLKAS